MVFKKKQKTIRSFFLKEAGEGKIEKGTCPMGGGNPGGGAATGGGKKAGLTCGAGCNAQSGRGGGIRWSKLGGGPRRGYDITSKTNTFN